MKLTKLQRYTAYCILLEEAERPGEWEHTTNIKRNGLCWMGGILFGMFDKFYNEAKYMLPEYFKRYIAAGGIRSGDWQPRIAILKECIKELEEKLF